MSPATQAIAYHEELAKGWSERYASGGFKRRADFFAAEILPRIAPRGDWIDVGCGSGVFSRMLARGGASVLGVDGSPAMIEAARAGSGPLPHYEVRAIETLARENAGFEGVLCLSVLEYLEDPRAALATLAGLARPGGTVVFSAPNRKSPTRLLQSGVRRAARRLSLDAFAYLASSRNAWSHRELLALVNASGLRCENVWGFDPILPRPIARLAPPSLWYLLCRKTDSSP